jgi:hypothetical protein
MKRLTFRLPLKALAYLAGKEYLLLGFFGLFVATSFEGVGVDLMGLQKIGASLIAEAEEVGVSAEGVLVASVPLVGGLLFFVGGLLSFVGVVPPLVSRTSMTRSFVFSDGAGAGAGFDAGLVSSAVSTSSPGRMCL